MESNLEFNVPEDCNISLIICGVGGTGSNLVPSLMQLLNSLQANITVTLIDGDLFEEKNMANQKLLPRDIGRAKSEVLCSRYKRVYPNLKLNFLDQYITDIEQLKPYVVNRGYRYGIRDYFPVLVSCVDNNATRQLFHRLFYDENVKNLMYLDSGNGTDDMQGQIVTGLKQDGRVILKPVADMFPGILEDNDDIQSEVGCAAINNEKPQNIATNILAATCLFSILNNLIAFRKIATRAVFFDAMKPEAIFKGITSSSICLSD